MFQPVGASPDKIAQAYTLLLAAPEQRQNSDQRTCVLLRKGSSFPYSLRLKDRSSCTQGETQRNKSRQVQRQLREDINKANNWQQGFSEDIACIVAELKACAKHKDLCKGNRLHADISKKDLLGKNIYVGSVLVNMYARCGAFLQAQEVFDGLPARDVVSWSTLLSGFVQGGLGNAAMTCFEHMQHEGLSPDAVTFISTLKACSLLRAAEKGEKIHAEVVRQSLLENDIILGTTLVDMYAKCGAMTKAQEVFEMLPAWNAISWNALITGYIHHGYDHEAINCYKHMQCEGFSPDEITFLCILKACGSIGSLKEGEEIHAEVKKRRMLGKHNNLGTALVDMYAKCGALSKAQGVFDQLLVQDVVAWSALIAGYAQHGHSQEALDRFEKMKDKGLYPDAVVFTFILKACGNLGAFEKGNEVHAEIAKQKLLAENTSIGNGLVDMYAKCCTVEKAQEVFDWLPVQNVVAWSALISGYAQLGKIGVVFGLLHRMMDEGVTPNYVTLTVLINACSHAGLAYDAEMYFIFLSTMNGIMPTLEHCACLVDLFGRLGHFQKALQVMDKLPHLDCADCDRVWAALMGACLKWENSVLGRLSFEHLVELNGEDAGIYVSMSNIYVDNKPDWIPN